MLSRCFTFKRVSSSLLLWASAFVEASWAFASTNLIWSSAVWSRSAVSSFSILTADNLAWRSFKLDSIRASSWVSFNFASFSPAFFCSASTFFVCNSSTVLSSCFTFKRVSSSWLLWASTFSEASRTLVSNTFIWSSAVFSFALKSFASESLCSNFWMASCNFWSVSTWWDSATDWNSMALECFSVSSEIELLWEATCWSTVSFSERAVLNNPWSSLTLALSWMFVSTNNSFSEEIWETLFSISELYFLSSPFVLSKEANVVKVWSNSSFKAADLPLVSDIWSSQTLICSSRTLIFSIRELASDSLLANLATASSMLVSRCFTFERVSSSWLL